MDRLKVFDNPDDIKKYVLCNANKKIGSGWEGNVYLSNDNSTLKLFKRNYKVPYTKDILTTSSFSLKSFIFPDELFICDNKIYGYKARYFAGNIFNTKQEVIIDLEKLIEARRKAISDIEVLTSNNYNLVDVYGNIMFDGENLAIIDTLRYYKKSKKTEENIKLLDEEINNQLMYIDQVTSALNIPFEDKIKRLLKNNNSKYVKYKGGYYE